MFDVPSVTDNSGAAMMSVMPDWFKPDMVLTSNLNVTYMAMDHAGNKVSCPTTQIVMQGNENCIIFLD